MSRIPPPGGSQLPREPLKEGELNREDKKGTTEIQNQKESLPLYSSFSLPRRLGVYPSFTLSYTIHTSLTLNICWLALVQGKARRKTGPVSCIVLVYSCSVSHGRGLNGVPVCMCQSYYDSVHSSASTKKN